MSILYPGKVKCPKCETEIKIKYDDNDNDVAETEDLLTLNIRIPLSYRSNSDASKNKQTIGKVGHYITICRHCLTIIGFNELAPKSKITFNNWPSGQ